MGRGLPGVAAHGRRRTEVLLGGRVQGLGLRPWAARHAAACGLAGTVRNVGDRVEVVLEGAAGDVSGWLAALEGALPPGAEITWRALRETEPEGLTGFAIAPSLRSPTGAGAELPRDVALCRACLAELFDPVDRRYRYAFTHCSECGPRAAVLLDLPYDRERTTLRAFPPCAACRAEYEAPTDRRYHAQTVACAACGPSLRALPEEPPAGRDTRDPVERAARVLAAGGIVAVKGFGGYHLACDATRADAVARLRKRKARPTRPFAVLLPGLPEARTLARLGAREEALLTGAERAIVVAPRREEGVQKLGLAPGVAPRTRDLGLLLPVAPVHWLLLYAPGSRPGRDAPRFPALVLTSANASGAPVIHRDEEAVGLLRGVADLVVAHDRAVARPNDDPVYRSAAGGPIPVRLSRGSAPRTLALPPGVWMEHPILALGGDRKCAPALARGGDLWLAEHVGDVESLETTRARDARVEDLVRLVGAEPARVVHDLHPDGLGAAWARETGLPTLAVQHHHAHAAACLAEHGETGPALAWVLDGAGHGPDGSVWGGELLQVDLASSVRLAHLETVPLPGGDAAVREPWRMAAVWLRRAFGDEATPRLAWHRRRDPSALARVLQVASRGLASPPTSSCGRLFDAVGSLLDCGDVASHEGEVAIALESLASRATPAPTTRARDATSKQALAIEVEVADLVRALVQACAEGRPPADVALAFHTGLAERLACRAAEAVRAGAPRQVVLSGGCLQNRLLLDALRRALAARGLRPLCHRLLPPNDGALAVGQAVIAAASSEG